MESEPSIRTMNLESIGTAAAPPPTAQPRAPPVTLVHVYGKICHTSIPRDEKGSLTLISFLEMRHALYFSTVLPDGFECTFVL